MNENTLREDPRPEFVEKLEWQLRTALRRRDRFSLPVARGASRVALTASLVVISLLCGAAGAVAAERYQDGLQRELELTQARYRVEIARFSLEINVERMERVSTLAERGLVSRTETHGAERTVHDAELELALATLDLDEIGRAGHAADSVDAPLVDGKDFVKRRGHLRLERARATYEGIRREHEELELLFDAGVVSSPELRGIERALAEAEGELRILEERLTLRTRFVNGEIDAQEARRLEQRLHSRRRMESARTAYDLVQGEVEEARRRVAAGLGGAQRVRELELELLRVEAELAIARLEAELAEAGRDSGR